jgi:hypothetical protein
VQSSTCNGVTLSSGGTCEISVGFSPVTAQTHSGPAYQLTLASRSGSLPGLALTGKGVAVSGVSIPVATLPRFATSYFGMTSASGPIASNSATYGDGIAQGFTAPENYEMVFVTGVPGTNFQTLAHTQYVANGESILYGSTPPVYIGDCTATGCWVGWLGDYSPYVARLSIGPDQLALARAPSWDQVTGIADNGVTIINAVPGQFVIQQYFASNVQFPLIDVSASPAANTQMVPALVGSYTGVDLVQNCTGDNPVMCDYTVQTTAPSTPGVYRIRIALGNIYGVTGDAVPLFHDIYLNVN